MQSVFCLFVFVANFPFVAFFLLLLLLLAFHFAATFYFVAWGSALCRVGDLPDCIYFVFIFIFRA